MFHSDLIEEYRSGPQLLREVVRGMNRSELDARPVPGRWTSREVVCHIADFEPIYADRMKRVIAENSPTFAGGDPDVFAAGLAYSQRDLEEELLVIEATRRQMARILKSIPASDFERTGLHPEEGPLTLNSLLTRITRHLPHHIRFIEEKKKAMQG